VSWNGAEGADDADEADEVVGAEAAPGKVVSLSDVREALTTR